jgi:hypothetical protein
MNFKPQYFPHEQLVTTGYQIINTKDITKNTIDQYFNSILNIFRDGIETEEVSNMKVNIIFGDNESIILSIHDYLFNIIFWYLCTEIEKPILSIHLFWPENITRKEIRTYIDNTFVDRYRKTIPFIKLNQTIDKAIGKFRELRPLQMYLANTLNLEDTIDLMNEYSAFDDAMHFSSKGIPLEDIKEKTDKLTKTQVDIIKNSDHCLKDAFRTGEGINVKQFEEVNVGIQTKPNGQGGVFEVPIDKSFINGGLTTPVEICIDSSVGRIAQILQKNHVGTSGEFERQLELNNQDSKLYPDPNYVCDTRNFEEVTIDTETKLNMYDLRYYRETPDGTDRCIQSKNCKHLIGKKIYVRSPMTCASAARGEGVCYKCYGDLAYVNTEINIGQIAAEGLGSIYTQILLSAKHLLKSMIIKANWPKEYYEIFNTDGNNINLQKKMLRGWKMVIDEDIKTEDDNDDIAYNYYINSFRIVSPEGKSTKINTADYDNLYLLPEFHKYALSCLSTDENDNDIIIMDMTKLLEFDSLFAMEIKNNELIATMNHIKKIIDNNSVIAQYDRNSILDAFTSTNIDGGITLNAVHFEVLLMNQIRDADDILETPDWTVPNAPYKILALKKSLENNPSIAVRLQYKDFRKSLSSPYMDKISKPSINDLYYMVKPQEYLSDEMVSDEYSVDDGVDPDIVEPISFENPKIRVGRKCKKRKIPAKGNINND